MTSGERKVGLHSAYLILLAFVTAALLIPFGYGVDLGPGSNRIRALIWEYMDAPWFSGVRFVRLGDVLEGLIYTIPRYFFIYQIFNLYRKFLKQRRMWFIGILGALFPGLVSLVRILGWVQGWTQPPPPMSDPYFPIYIPIPTILILGIVLLRLFPYKPYSENGGR